MKSYETFNGTQAEINKLVDHLAHNIDDGIWSQVDFAVDKKTFNKIFCEALTRNIVINEIVDMMNYIYNEEQEEEK